jgi:hypothetical protein
MSGSNDFSNANTGPLPRREVKSMKFKYPSVVAEFDSLPRQNARALDVGSQGSVVAYLTLGLNVG